MTIPVNKEEIMKDFVVKLRGDFEIQTAKGNLINNFDIEAKNFGEMINTLINKCLEFACIELKDSLELLANLKGEI